MPQCSHTPQSEQRRTGQNVNRVFGALAVRVMKPGAGPRQWAAVPRTGYFQAGTDGPQTANGPDAAAGHRGKLAGFLSRLQRR
jgi:hypothetical protein